MRRPTVVAAVLLAACAPAACGGDDEEKAGDPAPATARDPRNDIVFDLSRRTVTVRFGEDAKGIAKRTRTVVCTTPRKDGGEQLYPAPLRVGRGAREASAVLGGAIGGEVTACRLLDADNAVLSAARF